MKVILTTALFCVMMSFASAQCTDAQKGVFVASNLGDQCATQLLIVQTASNNTAAQTLDTALDTVCTSECGGRLTDYLRTMCNESFNATSLTLGCLKRNDANRPFTRCFNVFFTEQSAFDAAGSACSANITNQTTCASAGCQAILMNLALQFGCCYQSTYNSSTYLQSLVTQRFINSTDVPGILGLGNLALWTTCGVTPPSTCANVGNEFPTTTTEATTAHGTQLAPQFTVVALAMVFFIRLEVLFQ